MTTPAEIPIDAYRRTDFIVLHAGDELVVRLDETSAALDRLLAQLGASSGVFITGWNPFSTLTAPEQNHAANERMAALFAERAIRALPHVGRAHSGDWSEDGFFALDLDPTEALAIARAFDQIAVVHIALGGLAQLCFTGLHAR